MLRGQCREGGKYWRGINKKGRKSNQRNTFLLSSPSYYRVFLIRQISSSFFRDLKAYGLSHARGSHSAWQRSREGREPENCVQRGEMRVFFGYTLENWRVTWQVTLTGKIKYVYGSFSLRTNTQTHHYDGGQASRARAKVNTQIGKSKHCLVQERWRVVLQSIALFVLQWVVFSQTGCFVTIFLTPCFLQGHLLPSLFFLFFF